MSMVVVLIFSFLKPAWSRWGTWVSWKTLTNSERWSPWGRSQLYRGPSDCLSLASKLSQHLNQVTLSWAWWKCALSAVLPRWISIKRRVVKIETPGGEEQLINAPWRVKGTIQTISVTKRLCWYDCQHLVTWTFKLQDTSLKHNDSWQLKLLIWSLKRTDTQNGLFI